MKTTMPPLEKAAEQIAVFEGFESKPYQDSASIWTIGYGTIRYPDGRHVSATDPEIEESAALAFLEHDLTATATALWKAVKEQPTLNEWSAMLSLAYNVGSDAISKSTLMRLFNSGDVPGAADQFLVWNKAHVDGELVAIQGLTNRRTAERALFLTA